MRHGTLQGEQRGQAVHVLRIVGRGLQRHETQVIVTVRGLRLPAGVDDVSADVT